MKGLIRQYLELEELIRNKIGDLENAGEECCCDNREMISFIHEGEWKEIETFCINCGGVVVDE